MISEVPVSTAFWNPRKHHRTSNSEDSPWEHRKGKLCYEMYLSVSISLHICVSTSFPNEHFTVNKTLWSTFSHRILRRGSWWWRYYPQVTDERIRNKMASGVDKSPLHPLRLGLLILNTSLLQEVLLSCDDTTGNPGISFTIILNNHSQINFVLSAMAFLIWAKWT